MTHHTHLLAIDIRNTTVSFAVLKKKDVVQEYCLEQTLKSAVYDKKLKSILNALEKKYMIRAVVICSVVPAALKKIEKTVSRHYKGHVYVIGRNLKVPIKNKYKKPSAVGQDRLVGAYAAKTLYGCPALIVDFGTAITFDVVSQKGHYEGGIIVPGIRLSAESLFSKTALLPRVDKIRRPKSLIGKTTRDSILSGIFHGYAAMSDGLIQAISQGFQTKPKVVVTGGHTELMNSYMKRKVDKVDPHLVFHGMSLLYESIIDSTQK